MFEGQNEFSIDPDRLAQAMQGLNVQLPQVSAPSAAMAVAAPPVAASAAPASPDRPALDQSYQVIPYGQPGSSVSLDDVINGRTDLFDKQDLKAYEDNDPTTGFYRDFNDPATQAYYGLTPQRAYDLGLSVNPPAPTPQAPGFAGTSPLAEPAPPTSPPAATPATIDNGATNVAVTPPGTAPQAPAPSAAPNPALPDFGIYANVAAKYQPPPLMAADPSKGLLTSYYAPRTNSGDVAGAIPAVEGTPVRIIDNKTGQVVYSGVGPQAAQYVAGIANAASQSNGRKASWTVQSDFGNGWQGVAEDLKDTRHNLLGTLLDVAAPFILNALLPGVGLALTGALGTIGGAAAGGALANTLSGLAQGEGIGTALKGGLTAGAFSGLGAGVLGNLPSGIANPINDATRVVQGGFNTVLNPLTSVLSPLDSALSGGVDALGNVVGGARDAVAGVRNGVHDAIFGAGATPTAPVVNVPDIPDLSPLTVIGAPNISGFGLPTATNLSGVEVTPPAQQPTAPGVPTLDPAVVTAQPQTKDQTPVVTTVDPTAPVTLDPLTVTPAVPATTPTQVPVVTVPPPETPVIQTAQPDGPITPVQNPSIPGALPGVPTSPSAPKTYAVPFGPGTRESLDPIFRATLPPATFGHRTALPATVDERYAIQHPEARFFDETGPQARTSDFAVSLPGDRLLQGVGDLNRDGHIDALDLAIFRRKFGRTGFATGGAATGRGDGRSDSIPARLSDGEYVMDAETVSMLGNGSSQAGAKALDDFRVNIRKHKGRELAAGKFSAKAKSPQRYLRGA